MPMIAWVISSLHRVGTPIELLAGRGVIPSRPGVFTKGDGVHWTFVMSRTGNRNISRVRLSDGLGQPGIGLRSSVSCVGRYHISGNQG